jgi:replication fork clamp-binding protein CrfC
MYLFIQINIYISWDAVFKDIHPYLVITEYLCIYLNTHMYRYTYMHICANTNLQVLLDLNIFSPIQSYNESLQFIISKCVSQDLFDKYVISLSFIIFMLSLFTCALLAGLH